MASILLFAILVACQTTLIYGNQSSFATRVNIKKLHSKHPIEQSAPDALVNSAKLVMSMDSGDTLVRSARGAAAAVDGNNNANAANSPPAATTTTGKRSKNNNNSNKNRKSNKNTPSGENGGPTNTRKQHADKKVFGGAQNHEQQQHGNQHSGHNNNNNKNKGKQRQILKSQQHQSHGKRGGLKSKSSTNGDKTKSESSKTKSTCRYAKSAWSECDTKTHMRSRTLTLKKGESNCLPTRTMQKKCKKTCRYERGAWSECQNGQMTRLDTLKTASAGTAVPASGNESTCEPTRTINKKCDGVKQGGKSQQERKNKFKGGSRRAPQQA